MRRIAIALTVLALVAGAYACSPDAPSPTGLKDSGGGRPPTGASALQIRLFTSDPNPPAGSCTLLQAIVTLKGASVPDGTGVSFSTTFGFFAQNGQNVISVVTENSSAVTAVCSANFGTASVHATATVGGETGSAAITIAFQPVASAGPFISFCGPSFGPATGGTTLTINGGRFFGDASTTRVVFSAAGITREALVTRVTESQITVITPAFPEAVSPTVPVEIRVTLGTNTSSPLTLTLPNCFAFGTAPPTQPSITAVLPSSGTNEGNVRVTIIGSGFEAPVQVFFGPVEAQVLSVSFHQIVALTPPAFGAGAPNLNATVAVRVRNVNSGREGTLAGAFRYVTPVQIFSIDNNQQRVDANFTPVTIFGQGFQAPVAVTLAGIPATVISVSATELLVLPGRPFVTACADVVGPVGVTNINTGNGATGLTFRYLVEQTRPFISNVSPSSATAGPPPVTISGGNFTGVTSVRFGDRTASFTITSDSSISATAPSTGAAAPTCPAGVAAGVPTSVGTVSVTVRNASTGCESTGAQFTNLVPCVVAPTAPDLVLSKTSIPTAVAPGGTVAYRVLVSNAGTAAAAASTMTDVLPVGVTFVSCAPTQGTCGFAPATMTVTASFGAIPGPGTASADIVVTIAGPPRTVTNTASVTTSTPEPNTANNVGSATTTVTP